MLSNNRVDLNKEDVPIQTISFGQSNFILDNFKNNNNLKLHENIENDMLILKNDISKLNSKVLKINGDDSISVIVSSIRNLDFKIKELENIIERHNNFISENQLKNFSKNDIQKINNDIKCLEDQTNNKTSDLQSQIKNITKSKFVSFDNKVDSDFENVITDLTLKINESNKKISDSFDEKLGLLEKSLKNQIESSKLNSEMSTTIINGIDDIFKNINLPEKSDNNLEELVSSHLELDLNVKNNSNEIISLKDKINKNKNNMLDLVEIKINELREEFITILKNKEIEAERIEAERIEAERIEAERIEADNESIEADN